MRQGLPFRFLALCKALVVAIALMLTSAAMSLALAEPALAKRVALVIGNGDYENAGMLDNPAKDSKAIAGKLRALDFSVTEAIDSDLRTMRAALATFSEAASAAEVAVIFYAGHAIQVDGENYLIPVDAKLNSRSDLSSSTLHAREIYENLVKARPQVAVLILDACRDNPFAKAVTTSSGLASGSASSAMLVQPNSGGAIIGFAAAPGAVAFDGGDGNSPYTTALLQWIDRPGLELGTMLRRVRGTVVELTGGSQVPWVEEALLREVYMHPADPAMLAEREFGEKVQVALLDTMRAINSPEEKMAANEFYKRFTGDDETAVLVLGGTAENPRIPDDAFVTEGLVWLSIRQSRDPEAFRKFLKAYPEGPFASAATAGLARVEAEQEEIQVAELTNKTGILILGETTLTDVTEGPAQDIQLAAGTDADAAPELVAKLPDPEESASSASPPPAEEASPATASGEVKLISPDMLERQDPEEPAEPTDVAEPTDPAEPKVPVELSDSTEPKDPVEPKDRAEPDAPAEIEELKVAALVQETNAPLDDETALALSRDALSGAQMLLAASGEYRGSIDASFGPGTRKAIGAFQRSAGLDDSGYLNRATLQALTKKSGRKALTGLEEAGARASLHSVAAVAARGPRAQPITLRVAAMSRNDAVHAFWKDLAEDFEAAHPGYLVEITHQPDYEYKKTLLTKLGSPTPPDIMHTWGGGHLEALKTAGFARDLSREMAEGWALEFRPGVLQSFTQEGRIYGAPSSVELVSLWANKALLDKAGVRPDQLATWDGLLQAVRQLRSAGVTPIAIGGRDRWQFQFLFGMLAQQIGGRDAFDAAYAGGAGGFTAQPFVLAGDRLRQLADLDPFQPDFLSLGEGEAGMLFAKGQAAMMVTGNWRLSTLRWNWTGGFDRMKNELVRLDLPSSAQDPDGPLTYGGADGYVVNSKAPDMAVELLRVLVSPQVQTKIAELADSVPAVSGADLGVTDPFLSDVAGTLLRSSHHQLYYDQALGPDAGEVLNDVAARLATGQMGGADAAREIDRAWQQALLERTGEAPATP